MDKRSLNYIPEVWGGIECTINRVMDDHFDQLHHAGHYNRDNDLEIIADLGIKAMRYPVLWERHQPAVDSNIDWSFTEKQLNTLSAKGIKPIAGLIHHGSGPSFTNLLDDNFAPMLARYARQVAEKFPWIESYTPVNEPLTTARFSGLYALWYPHKSNDVSFVKMFLNQMKGVVLSMQAIREINPTANLIQTEDLGKTYSTPVLQYQAKFENERRWMTFDLLCGRIIPGHPMYAYFKRLGIHEELINFFIENACPPDIMGFNHYLTSERFLDDDIFRHHPSSLGGNELHQYADVEAIRIPHGQPSGLKMLLQEAWDRYHLPIAITEVQLNSTGDQQMRWLKSIWDNCCELISNGVEIRAVTAWSLLGAFGWNDLLTSERMDYEPGAFDISSGELVPTALVELITSLANNKDIHPVKHPEGWWESHSRFLPKTHHENSKDYKTPA